MVAQQNPFLLPIAKILRTAAAPLSEYELLKRLDFGSINLCEASDLKEEKAPENDAGHRTDQTDLLLFRKHFLVMNALYSLQPIFWEEGLQLKISALEIVLLPVADTTADRQLADPGEQVVREYYLDWQQLANSSCDSVAALLQSFWQRYQAYYASDQTIAALRCLGLVYDEPVCNDSKAESNETENLTAQLSLSQIKQAYRRLASSHHPDKGGDSERFMEIREAYEHLACLYSG